MKAPDLDRKTIRALYRDLRRNRYAIPKLQRNFIWNAARAAKLLDSIYCGMPIGALFLWEMDRKSAHLIRQSTGILPAFNTANRRIAFVIDGQQRLSVIYKAFEGKECYNDVGKKIDFGKLCFAVRAGKRTDEAPRIVYRKPDGDRYVPLSDVLAPTWQRSVFSRANWRRKRIENCRKRLLDYPVPIVTVRQASLDEIGEVFIRLNSQGMRITNADRAIALMGALDVREMAMELRQRIREKHFDIRNIDSILMGLNLVTAQLDKTEIYNPRLDALARRWSKRIANDVAAKKRFRKIWHKYQNAFELAVDYLRNNFHVHDESFLPSVNMPATLCIFFFHHRGQPNAAQKKEIRKWFWTTGIAQRYSGRGYYPNIVADARMFTKLAERKRHAFVFREYLDPNDIKSTEYSSSSARSRTFLCLLAACKPKYLDNAESIPLQHDVISRLNKPDRHHIFPRKQMMGIVSSRSYNSLCNICLISAHDNKGIGKKLPRVYLKNYRDTLASPHLFRRVMASLMIPAGRGVGVWQTDLKRAFRKFQKERLSLICKTMEKQAGTRLFQNKN